MTGEFTDEFKATCHNCKHWNHCGPDGNMMQLCDMKRPEFDENRKDCCCQCWTYNKCPHCGRVY